MCFPTSKRCGLAKHLFVSCCNRPAADPMALLIRMPRHSRCPMPARSERAGYENFYTERASRFATRQNGRAIMFRAHVGGQLLSIARTKGSTNTTTGSVPFPMSSVPSQDQAASDWDYRILRRLRSRFSLCEITSIQAQFQMLQTAAR